MRHHEETRAAGTSLGRRLAARLAVTLLVVAVLGPIAAVNAAAALGPRQDGFVSSAPIESVGRGEVPLAIPNGAPGDEAVSFVTVRYRAGEPARIELFGTTGGTGLDRYLVLTVTRGLGHGEGFVADETDYVGAGPGVVFRGRLADFPDELASAISDPAGPVDGPTEQTYRLHVRMTGSDAAQGLTAVQTFSWTAVPV